MPAGSLKLLDMKDYYWPIGTHYYEPLKGNYKNRKEFIKEAQHPMPNLLVVGEMISENQGWTQGALESVKAVVSKKWVIDR
jgi:monoamine oxidase